MRTPDSAKNVVIIGAGIVGVSTAIWLQREGFQVTLIERESQAGEGASYGNAGLVSNSASYPMNVPGLLGKAPGMVLDRSQPLFLKWRYLPRLAPWLLQFLRGATPDTVGRTAQALHALLGDAVADHQALAAGTGAQKWVVKADYLVAYKDRAAFELDAEGWAMRKRMGFHWDELESVDFLQYDPVFSRDLRFAAKLPGHGRITDPGRYVKQLAAHVVANGGRLFQGEVGAIVVENGRVSGVRADGNLIECDRVVVAAGAWSKTLMRGLGLRVPLESERGYHLEVWDPSFMPRTSTMITTGKFVMTPMEGRLRLAGIVEFGGLQAPPSRAPFELLRRHLRATLPGLTWAHQQEWMGHRPTLADSVPMIGEVPGAKGVFLGFGHHHVGLTGGPKTGQLLAQLIAGKTPNIDMAPYAPGRFS